MYCDAVRGFAHPEGPALWLNTNEAQDNSGRPTAVARQDGFKVYGAGGGGPLDDKKNACVDGAEYIYIAIA
jgi:hypothetical protein